jgi:hypothetical protein
MDELDGELDWRLLGSCYCAEGGEHFFERDQRTALADAGLRFASDVVEALEQLPAGPRTSLYVGVGVAELAPLVAERVLLGRSVAALTLPGPEPTELNRALEAVGRRIGHELGRIETDPIEPARVGPIGHLWLVSVLTDPDHFPALHDRLYERAGSALATGRGDVRAEESAAERLVDGAVACLRAPALLTTSDEELEWMRRACARRDLQLAVPPRARLSGIVGDPVRTCRVGAR